MASNKMVAEVYRENWVTAGLEPESGKWRWRLIKGRNILADSGGGYSRRIDCLRGLRLVAGPIAIERPGGLTLSDPTAIPVRFL